MCGIRRKQPVLGIPHPAVATRDVALYRPFRTALQMNQVIGLPTLMWRLMRRRVQEGALDSVSSISSAISMKHSQLTCVSLCHLCPPLCCAPLLPGV